MESRRQFASDNYSGICPEAWDMIAQANHGHAPSYGEDKWTQRASDLIRKVFEIAPGQFCDVFFTFNGTAANALALAAMCRSYHSVICHELAHVETDECGAPEFFSNGTKLLTVPGEHGRVRLDAVEETVHRRKDIHYPKPNVLTITQATELGTVYSVEQLRAIEETTKNLSLKLHVDGARFANAVVTLGVTPKQLTWQVGVDVLCLGGTKNGLPVGDAVVFFNPDMAYEFEYRCKQAGQLASKMRFLTAGWVGILETGAWLAHACQANRCAKLLESELREIEGIEIMSPVEANSVFVRLPPKVADGLRQRGWKFYTFIGNGGARFMASWDTTEDDVHTLADDIRQFARLT